MSYPLSEQTPNGLPAIFATLPPEWKKLLLAKQRDQDPSQPIALQSGLRAPERMEGDEPIVSPRPVEPMQRERRVEPSLPVLPERGINDALQGAVTKQFGYPADADLPVIPYRPSSAVFAPDKTVNPDYVGHQPTVDESAIRPKVNDELGYAVTHTPMPRHGRVYEGFKGAGLGFLRGVAATGTLGGGLGGAATLGTMSAIDPKYAESAQNQMFTIPRLQQQEAIRVGRNETALKQRGQAADIGLKESQTYRNLHPLPQTELVKVKGQGAFLVNKQTGSKMKVDLPDEVNPDEWEQTEANGLLYWKNKRTQETKPMTYNGQQLQNDADVPVDVTPDGGPTLRTRQGQAASALIEAGSKGATISNQQSVADREAAVKQIDDNYTQDATRRTQARQEVNDLQGLIRQAEAEQAEVQSPVGDTDEKKQAYARFHAQKYKALWDAVNNKAQQIRSAYGDVIEESDQSLPEPGGGSMSEGMVRGATGGNRKYPTGVKPQGAKQAYPPPVTYRSAPVPKVSVRGGSQAQGKQVIDAQAYAKDHNISVEEARKLINSTPGNVAGN